MSPVFGHGIGMEFLLLLPPLGAAVLFGVVTLPAAYLSRTAGRVCGGLTIVSVALFYFVILWGNHWSWGSLAYTFIQPVHARLNGLLLFAGMVSLAGLLVPLAPATIPGNVDRERMRLSIRRNRRVVFLLLGLPVICLVTYGLWYWRDTHLGQEKLFALLDGSDSVRFSSVRFEDGYQRRVVCTDPVVLRYLESRLRSLPGDSRRINGDGYEITVWFVGGGQDSFGVEVGEKGLSLWIPRYDDGRPGSRLLWDYGPTYYTDWAEPIPPACQEMLRFLQVSPAPQENVLILGPDGIRRERDASILAQEISEDDP